MATKNSEKPEQIGEQEQDPVEEHKPTCGIIMPISAIGGLSKEHWEDVRTILNDIIESAGFVPNLVSDGSDVGVIQNRIINNIYNSDIIVCDVSEKNPNVMFELGLRLAFDKPTIIIKDEITSYSFDTSPIEHLDYPRDLRYNLIENFKIKLKSKLINTFAKAKSDKNYTTFLGHFGNYKPSKIEDKELPALDILLKQMDDLRSDMKQMYIHYKGESLKDNISSVIASNQMRRIRKSTEGKTLGQIIDDDLKSFSFVNNLNFENVTKEHLEDFLLQFRRDYKSLIQSLDDNALLAIVSNRLEKLKRN